MEHAGLETGRKRERVYVPEVPILKCRWPDVVFVACLGQLPMSKSARRNAVTGAHAIRGAANVNDSRPSYEHWVRDTRRGLRGSSGMHWLDAGACPRCRYTVTSTTVGRRLATAWLVQGGHCEGAGSVPTKVYRIHACVHRAAEEEYCGPGRVELHPESADPHTAVLPSSAVSRWPPSAAPYY